MRDDESEFNPATPERPEQSTNGSAPPQTVAADQAIVDEASNASADVLLWLESFRVASSPEDRKRRGAA